MTAAPPAPLTGMRKGAVLLVLLGDDAAAAICKNLPQEELRLLAKEIAELGYISPEVATTVLQEYQQLTGTQQEHVAQGGPEYAKRFLVKTLGDEGSRSLVDQVVRSKESSTQSLEALQKADPQQLAKFLQEEHPQTIALVLAHLSDSATSAILSLLPETIRAQSIKRLAQMQNFSPEMVNKISSVLQRKLAALGGPQNQQDRRSYGGVKAVAALLNSMNSKVTASILEEIETDSADLAASIRNQMFTFEDFLEVPETGLRELLTNVDKKALATAIKGASEELKNHFFKCMSSRAVEMFKEDAEALGPLRAKDVNQAQIEIIAVARKLEADGKMTLRNETEEALVV